MSSISLRHIYKVYPKKEKQKFKLFRKKNENSNDEEVLAVDDFNMEIEDGEFVVFVGPSEILQWFFKIMHYIHI